MSDDEKVALEDQEWISVDEDEEEEKVEEPAAEGTVYSRDGNGPLYIVQP